MSAHLHALYFERSTFTYKCGWEILKVTPKSTRDSSDVSVGFSLSSIRAFSAANVILESKP